MCKVILNLLGKQKSEVLKILLDLYMLGKDFEWSGFWGFWSCAQLLPHVGLGLSPRTIFQH
jgi:hypothetical protein